MSPRRNRSGHLPGKALWAILVSNSCGPCFAECSNRSAQLESHCDVQAKRNNRAHSLLQVRIDQVRSRTSDEGTAWRPDRERSNIEDGSQISLPGPPLALDEALRQLGAPSALALGQDGTGVGAEALRKGLDGIAVVYVSGRTDFDAALRESVLQYTPMGGIFKTEGKVPANFIKALDYSFEKFPKATWYYIADDDSFVHLDRLAMLASTFDASSKQYVGHRDCAGTSCKVKVNCKRETMLSEGGRNPGWACGGPGVLLSRPLVEDMAARSCSDYYGKEPAPVCCGDMALACCAFDAWEGLQITDAPTLSPYQELSNLKLAREDVVAVHKLLPNVTLELGKIYNSHLAPTVTA